MSIAVVVTKPEWNHLESFTLEPHVGKFALWGSHVSSTTNFLGTLSSLSDLQMRQVELAHKQRLLGIGDEVRSVYFPINSIVSVVAPLSTGESLEVAMVGRDGGVGIGAALDGRISQSQWIVQHPGAAFMCDAPRFREVVLRNADLVSAMFHHEQLKFAEVQQSAVCVAAHHVEARFARWLLRARDLSDTDELRFTQEYLAEMLAVRRSSVSPVATKFQAKGLIRYSRGSIKILDALGLKSLACECYDTVKQSHRSLTG